MALWEREREEAEAMALELDRRASIRRPLPDGQEMPAATADGRPYRKYPHRGGSSWCIPEPSKHRDEVYSEGRLVGFVQYPGDPPDEKSLEHWMVFRRLHHLPEKLAAYLDGLQEKLIAR
jgi:hypothetical protein